MSEDLIRWPAWMPNPYVDNYGIRVVDRRRTGDMEEESVYRVEFDTDECEATCFMILDQDEAAFFEAFERGVLNHGCRWFEIPLWVGGELEEHTVRFKTRPQGGQPEGVNTPYTFTLAIAERKLLCPDIAAALVMYSPHDLRMTARALCLAVNDVMPGCTNMPGL